MRQFIFSFLVVAGLAALAHPAVAQEGGKPVTPSKNTRYILRNSVVMERKGSAMVPLDGNIKLPNGTKVNYKSGIVELPTGKITTLHEGDYVKADGSIVFATPASAAAAMGNEAQTQLPPDTKFSNYIITGNAPSASGSARQVLLLQEKINLLNQKIDLMAKAQTTPVPTTQIDQQLLELESELALASGK